MDPKKNNSNESKVTFKLEKEKITPYTEAFENTLNNVYAISAFVVKTYGRAGYQIKLLEQILGELKKLNQDKK